MLGVARYVARRPESSSPRPRRGRRRGIRRRPHPSAFAVAPGAIGNRDTLGAVDAHRGEAGKQTGRLGRRAALILAGSLLVLVLIVAVAVGVNRMGSGPVPSPLWSKSDLPRVPAVSDNGWVVMQRGMPSVGRLDTPGKARSICNADSVASASDRWQSLEHDAPAIESFLSDPGTLDALRLVSEAATKPAFADACVVEGVPACPFLTLMRAHNAAELKILMDARAERWSPAWEAAARLVRMDLAHLRSARSGLSNMSALANARRVVELLALLADRYAGIVDTPPDGTRPPQKIGAELDGAPIEQMTMERAVITEYLFLVYVLEDIQDKPSAAGVSHPRFDAVARAFFDPSATRAELNRYYGALAAFAREPAKGPPPTAPALRADSLWWVRNPVGKLVLEEGLTDFGDVIARYERGKAALATRKKVVRESLRKLEH